MARKRASSSFNDYQEFVPVFDKNYIRTSQNYNIISNVIEGGKFCPVFVYGITGIGKTSEIEQACAELNRPFFRCQITRETVDDDLIGSMKLVDGNTVWQDGPVIKAYKCGGILLLDEMDLNPYLMILQGILEGKPFFIKQTGELVTPAPGFNVFATSNSKGLGESDYIGTMVLNEAQRDRFALYLEQEIPSINQEKAIAKKYIRNEDLDISPEMFTQIFKWVDLVRKAYIEGSSNIFISTRRIHFLLTALSMFKEPIDALRAALSVYTKENCEALILYWNSVSNIIDEQMKKKEEKANSSNENESNLTIEI